MPIYECNSACTCPAHCRNRIVQRGISQRIQVFKTKYKGWAVRALERIPVGSFVCEYVGEVITTDEAERRGIEYDKVRVREGEKMGGSRCRPPPAPATPPPSGARL